MNHFLPNTAADFFADGDARRWLEAEILPAYLTGSRWFGGKARGPERFAVAELVPVEAEARLALVRVDYRDGGSETYQLPLLSLLAEAAAELLADHPAALITRAGEFCLVDAIYHQGFREALWKRIFVAGEEPPASRVLKIEQSNSSLLYGDRVFVKLFRKLEQGLNPDVEILRHLTDGQRFAHSPAYLGSIEHHAANEESMLLAVAVSAVPNQGDAWSFALRELEAFYARVDQRSAERSADPIELVGSTVLERCAQLGTRTGELHLALAMDSEDPAFSPEPLSAVDLKELSAAILASWEKVLTSASVDSAARLELVALQLQERAQQLGSCTIAATKARTHGDYHLGQVLETGTDFVIIDFEGEPARSLAERRLKRSPLRDVAGMLRSFHYAAHAARLALSAERTDLDAWAETWTQLAGQAFLNAWLDCTEGASFRPATRAQFDLLLEGFLLEKVIYEVSYELNNRPAWLPIPLRGLQRLLGAA